MKTALTELRHVGELPGHIREMSGHIEAIRQATARAADELESAINILKYVTAPGKVPGGDGIQVAINWLRKHGYLN